MLPADLDAAVEVTAAAFSKDLGDAEAMRRWRERILYPWQTDPDGAFVAERDGGVIGVAEAIVRERMWCLSMLGVEPGIQGGAAGRDLEALAALTRQVRGAPYTSELRFALGRGDRLLRAGDRGFAVVDAVGHLWVLVARDEDAARVLLWSALGRAQDGARVRWITGARQWAIHVVGRAGLRLMAYGALCVRGTPGPLAPFLPSASFA